MKILWIMVLVLLTGCVAGDDSTQADKEAVERQQKQYQAGQPIPVFDWSLERDLVRQLYQIRNEKAATHAVWRGEMSMIEGDCPSLGFGLPYDTSLTNPLIATEVGQRGYRHSALTSIEQPEPNGIFQSKSTSATWVMCVLPSGDIAPVYVEAKVTVYPYPVSVDYDKNRVVPVVGRKPTATITVQR
jgi:hypothetical protein